MEINCALDDDDDDDGVCEWEETERKNQVEESCGNNF